MTSIGTPLSPTATKLLLLGSGELGKEVAISAQRLGIEVIALDKYPNAPAMQVAHRSHVISMQDKENLARVINNEQPDYIVPEIEAIATDTLIELEQQGFNIIPTAKATQLTMDREGIRRLAAEKLSLPTSPYQFASSFDEYELAIKSIGYPCIIKPLMSSSGKGQSIVSSEKDINKAWDYAQTGARGNNTRVIIEGFVDLDYEITLLTVKHQNSTSYCAPIGHRQENGDYQESWQPHPMSEKALEQSQYIAKTITDALGGCGLFGVELFIKDDEAIFSEVSPRPHDTGMVTLISQQLSEFDLHVRAILGLPIPNIRQWGPSASHVILGQGHSNQMKYTHLEQALQSPDTTIRLFGKPEIQGERRLGVALALDNDIESARAKAKAAAEKIKIDY